MIVPNRFTLDTNILIYAVDRSAGDKREAADSLMRSAAKKDCYLTLQCLGEFFHAATRKGLASFDEAATYTDIWQQVYAVTAATPPCFKEALEAVRDHRFSYWDAMLWATAKDAGCAYILSEDMQNNRRLGGVEIVNPLIPESAELLAKLLG